MICKGQWVSFTESEFQDWKMVLDGVLVAVNHCLKENSLCKCYSVIQIFSMKILCNDVTNFKEIFISLSTEMHGKKKKQPTNNMNITKCSGVILALL